MESSVKEEVAKNITEEKKQEQVVQEVAQEVKAENSTTQALKALRGWNEIVEQASAGDDSILGFLKTAKAFIDGNGEIYIRFPNKFAMDMALAKKTLKADLRAALCILLKKQISDDNIHYGVFEGNENELEELDDLNLN